jgi:hypothetical protein
MNANTNGHSHIQGWGADLDPSNRPAYPKERTPPRLENVPLQIEQQRTPITVFHSTERPQMTPLFGTSTPPSGLSGLIRKAAFKLSENDVRHWLMLLFADRVNVVEGILSDLARGHIPNIPAEMGWRAEYKYNRKGAMRKVALGAALVGLTTWWLVARRSSAKEA